MLCTLETVRANLRNREGQRVFYLGEGDCLTSEARDFLNRERIAILPASRAKPHSYRLQNGGRVVEKPEHMTHLNAEVLVPKTHPRIRFRGAMDSLEAELLLCQAQVRRERREQLQEVLDLARNILRWEVLEEPAAETTLCGMSQAELRSRSHRPQDYYEQPHFMPQVSDGMEVLLLNRVRCAVRAAELAAAEAFTDRDGNPTRGDLLQALNRMSSCVYLLMIQTKAGK